MRLTNYLADPVELRLLHMVTSDPKRTPSTVLFANTDFWLSSGSASCGASCVTEPKGTDAWNHGDVSPQINTTWLGMAGPGVAHLGIDNSAWTDHVNIQPTMMELLGLRDDYVPDGRVDAEVITPSALPPAMRASLPAVLRLGRVYAQINSPVGAFGLDTLRASTRGLASASAGDAVYARTERQLSRLGRARNALAAAMLAELDGAAFHGRPVPAAQARRLIRLGQRLLGQAALLAR